MQESKLSRRPLKTRGTAAAHTLANWLAKWCTPNQISVIGVVFAIIAGGGLVAKPYVTQSQQMICLVGAAIFIQLRLLCNLMDGMVAVEGGKGTKSGEIYNDMPDRIADFFILVGAGYSITFIPWGNTLGWGAAFMAVMTAYTRLLGNSLGAGADYRGPMAKPHRMALVTFACLASLFENLLGWHGEIMAAALAIIILGSIITVMRRISRTYRIIEYGEDK